ncbi:MAG TPA: response regulator [Tepidisphaeraceae bacterium]|jgi:two-component system response regulator RegA|nr:response regulator [Tepidisphaeraceae bacterium]
MVEEPKRKSSVHEPDRATPRSATRAPGSPHAPAGLLPRTYLVIDDDAAFRDRLVRALVARGLQARGAACGADALALAQVSPPEAATVDLRMPGGTGLDLIRDLLALSPRIQIVVLTGYGNIATAVEAVRRGAIDYLTKPLDTDQILAAFDPAASKATDAATELTPTLARVEWEHIQRILTDCNGNISKTARKLGLHRRSLQRKLSKLPPEE